MGEAWLWPPSREAPTESQSAASLSSSRVVGSPDLSALCGPGVLRLTDPTQRAEPLTPFIQEAMEAGQRPQGGTENKSPAAVGMSSGAFSDQAGGALFLRVPRAQGCCWSLGGAQ